MNYFLIIIIFLSLFYISFPQKDFFPSERDALLKLRDSIDTSANLHSLWTGPPCSLNQTNWPGIACSNSHVVRLVLQGINLTGALPPTFLHNLTFLTKLSFRNNSISGPLPNLTNLMHIEHVFLSHNHFSGSIPLDYIHLPNLIKLELQRNYLSGLIPPFNQFTIKDFNVSRNNLEGPIPQTKVLGRFPESSFDHNLALCGKPSKKSCTILSPAPTPTPLPPTNALKPDKVLKKWVITLIISIVVIFLALVMITFFYYHKRRHKKETTTQDLQTDRKITNSRRMEDPENMMELEFLDKNIAEFELDDLLRAPANILGKSNMGTTYKVTLESSCVFAVKRVTSMDALPKREFDQQLRLLGMLRHQNLAHLISFYNSNDEKLIVYEFVSNGSLFDLLHENRGVARITINWGTRLSMIKDIATGLNFLHESLASHRVPHANLKSSNILIIQSQNDHPQAKLTDYGFLPLLFPKKVSENLAVGRCPEFYQKKKLTLKADVYCFGIILLELITGRIPGEMYGKSFQDLGEWVRMVVNDDWSTDILDVEIVATSEGHDQMLKLTEIALECTDVAPEKRPLMSQKEFKLTIVLVITPYWFLKLLRVKEDIETSNKELLEIEISRSAPQDVSLDLPKSKRTRDRVLARYSTSRVPHLIIATTSTYSNITCPPSRNCHDLISTYSGMSNRVVTPDGRTTVDDATVAMPMKRQKHRWTHYRGDVDEEREEEEREYEDRRLQIADCRLQRKEEEREREYVCTVTTTILPLL
ncbi:hypothetical protein ACFE04_024809 [Oxalis oulophora]